MQPGLTALVELTVTADDTAVALRSGDVPVLATPRVVALAEQATVAAVGPALEPGQTTVGTRVELDHLVPTPVGGTVVASARLVSIDGRRLVFEVVVYDSSDSGYSSGEVAVARGRIERVVVERQRFLPRVGPS